MMSDVQFIGSQAELAVLGGLMRDNSALDRVDFLKPGMFTGFHQDIFAAMQSQADKRLPFDAVTLSEMGGDLVYLGTITKNTMSTANIRHYAKRVQEEAQRREVVSICGEIIDQAHDLPIAELTDMAQERVLGLSEKDHKGPSQIRDVLRASVDALDSRFHRGGAIIGLPTGFQDLDELLAGLQRSDLFILAGRPAMGKTTLAMNIAQHVSRETPVLVFSLEMPEDQLADRMVCAAGAIDFKRYRTGQLDDDDWPKVTTAVSLLAEHHLEIDDQGGLTIGQIRARARKAHRKAPLGLVVVDYLQLITHAGKSEGRRLEIEAITRGLKEMAKELNIPVIALSQLSRSVENRTNKRPMMSDLRESGSIEQDADVIAFVYRDEVYNEDSPDCGVAEVIVGKHRNGDIGTRRLAFQGQHCRFMDLVIKWGEQ